MERAKNYEAVSGMERNDHSQSAQSVSSFRQQSQRNVKLRRLVSIFHSLKQDR